MSEPKILTQAFIHGRFQPPHVQHMEYILAAKARCLYLWIGITRYDIQEIVSSPVAPHREALLSNPLTFFERIEIITAALRYAGIDRSEFGFVPIPIEQPNKILNFIRNDIHCFTTICDEWNLHKIQTLEGLGFVVEVLIDRQKQLRSDVITGSDIRNKVIAHDINWKTYIPGGALEVLENLGFQERIEKIAAMDSNANA